MEHTKLSSTVTVAKYRQLEAEKDRTKIADFILQRFTERYIRPLRGDSTRKHGFCTMAISCLMIEALESFWNGWPDTERRSREAFRSFFKRCSEKNSPLGVFAEHVEDFYRSVRCAILHQAETTNGWCIRREGSLFDPGTKTINATLFHNELEKVLRAYCSILKQSDWDSEEWQNLRKKMQAVIENCRPPSE